MINSIFIIFSDDSTLEKEEKDAKNERTWTRYFGFLKNRKFQAAIVVGCVSFAAYKIIAQETRDGTFAHLGQIKRNFFGN